SVPATDRHRASVRGRSRSAAHRSASRTRPSGARIGLGASFAPESGKIRPTLRQAWAQLPPVVLVVLARCAPLDAGQVAWAQVFLQCVEEGVIDRAGQPPEVLVWNRAADRTRGAGAKIQLVAARSTPGVLGH